MPQQQQQVERLGAQPEPQRPDAAAWQGVVVAASCADPLRLLRSRDMRGLRAQAGTAGCTLLPVLLTSPAVAPGRQAAALQALADACGTAPAAVQVLCVPHALLQPAAAEVPAGQLTAALAACQGVPQLQAQLLRTLEAQHGQVASLPPLPRPLTPSGPDARSATALPWVVSRGGSDFAMAWRGPGMQDADDGAPDPRPVAPRLAVAMSKL